MHLPGVKSVSRKSLIQKKILDQSLKDTYTAYIQENPTDKASFSTFCKHRPKHILSYTKTPFIQCVCEICQNPVAKMKAIDKHLDHKIDVDGGLDKLINMTLCPLSERFASLKCIDRECLQEFRRQLDQWQTTTHAENITIKWQQWEKSKDVGKGLARLDKIEKTSSMA